MKLIQHLQSRGVIFLAPETTFIAEDVNPDAIAPNVVIHPGCRLSGAKLSIGSGSIIGAEAPATVIDCQLGLEVHLAGGFFGHATFLNGFRAGSDAHVRPGCLFEEGSSIAHAVGVKQTVFLPWVTAGSLINLCDCLMAGGTSRKNHSEIGSSYIHFNFTPHQDKATASLIGEVPHGVLLNQPAIFLGGQGGLVGPSVIAYGTVIPAGQIWRGDITEQGHLVAKATFRHNINMPYDPRQYHDIKRILKNNLLYIGNILALDAWYRIVRAPFMKTDRFQNACFLGARHRLDTILTERLARLDELAEKVAQSLTLDLPNPAAEEQRAFVEMWPQQKTTLSAHFATRDADIIPVTVQKQVDALPKINYLNTLQSLPPAVANTLTTWLTSIVSSV